RTRVRFSSDV
ncbi:hypothetical protein D030_5427B, partial [Vibrio parahaemolyticus AQ3810]